MNREEINREIEEVLKSIGSDLEKGNMPKEIEIQYILEHQTGEYKLSEEQLNRFAKMAEQINKIQKQEKKHQELVVKKESFLDKIPFIRKIKQWNSNRKINSQTNYYQDSNQNMQYTPTEKRNQFKEELSKDTTNQSIKNEPKINKEEIIVVSDLHSRMDRFEFVKSHLRENPKSKFIILGDATDRGEYGLEMLMEIKELSDKGRVEYLPGNHDIFAYNYVRSKANKDESIYKEAKWNLEHNGGLTTMEKLDNFERTVQNAKNEGLIHKDITKNELVNWLGTRRIQLATRQNNINYALAHAVFDAKLYNYDSKFNLEKAYNLRINGKNQEILDRFDNCMWYREKEEETHHAPITKIRDYVMVVGHTSQRNINMNTVGPKEQMPIIYVDTGKAKGLEGYNLTTGRDIKFIERSNER